MKSVLSKKYNVIVAPLLFFGSYARLDAQRIEKGERVEKKGISICYDFQNRYITTQFGTPYGLTITNHNNNILVVDPSIILDPLISYHKIAEARREEYRHLAVLSLVGFGSGIALFLTGNSSVTYQPLVSIAGISVLGSFAAFSLYKMIFTSQADIERALQKEVLHAPITLRPGEKVIKLFWLVNSKGPDEMDFDAVKVLK